MADPRFFDRAGALTLDALAGLSGASLVDPADGARLVHDVAPLETAGPDDVTFLDNPTFPMLSSGSCCVIWTTTPSDTERRLGTRWVRSYRRARRWCSSPTSS